jgi:hypothetical protein
MKALFSHVENPFSEHPTDDYVEMTALANYFAKKQGFETIFWGDAKALKNFKKIKFSETYELPVRILKDFPKCFWAAGKLLTLSLMNEPCIHIDNDLFLTKPVSEDFLNNDIYCFHDEHFAMKGLSKMQDLFKIRPKETLGQEIISYNCGVMGGQDIETVKKSINIIFDFISDNANYIDLVNLTYDHIDEYNYFFYTPVLIEQMWLFQIHKNFGKQITPLLHIENWNTSFEYETRRSGFIHLMQQKKFFKQYIREILMKKNIQY